MKLQSLLSLALTAQLSAAALLPRGFPRFEKRQSIASMAVTALNMPYGLNKGAGKLQAVTQMPPKHPNVPGFKTVKVRYGPYKVPNMGVTTRTLTGPEEGMLWNYPDTRVSKPCTGSCVIVGIRPDYEDLQGNSVNVDTGAWMHHIVILNSNKLADPTCAKRSNSLPHWVVGMNPASSERFFASGNERTTVRLFDMNITDAGYQVSPSDTFALIVDLMNMNKQDQTLYVVMNYDIIEGRPQGMKAIKPIWLDVDQCGFSEAKARSQTGSYSIASAPWTSTVDGELIVMGGHIHDGGLGATIKADGKVVCDSKAGYGENAKFISPGGAGHGMDMGAGAAKSSTPAPKAGAKGAPKGKTAAIDLAAPPPEAGEGGHGHGGAGKPHISSMVLCWRGRKELTMPTIRTGQRWTVEAQYDYKKFAGATHPNGQQENVMGIGIIWVKTNKAIA